MAETFKENDVFRGLQGKNACFNACVGSNGGPYDLYDYAHGYFEAAQQLINAAQKPDVLIDVIVYPVCLNFRHALELFVKYLIADLAKVTGSKDKYRPSHALDDNWRVAKGLIKSSKLKASAADVETLGNVVAAFMDVDPSGATFRYPETIKGDQHLRDWSLINIVVLERAHEKVFNAARRLHHHIEDLLDR